VSPWAAVTAPFEPAQGLSWKPVQQRLVHRVRSQELQARSFLAAPKFWAEIDYHKNQRVDVGGAVEFEFTEPGNVHALGAWFEAELMEGVRYASGPGVGSAYSNLMLPLEETLAVQPGDQLKVRIQSNEIGGEYQLSWWTSQIRDGRTIKALQQGEFMAQPLEVDRLKQRLPTYVPKLARDGAIAREILQGAHEGRPLGEIAARLLEAFPKRFANATAAVEHAANVLEMLNG